MGFSELKKQPQKFVVYIDLSLPYRMEFPILPSQRMGLLLTSYYPAFLKLRKNNEI